MINYRNIYVTHIQNLISNRMPGKTDYVMYGCTGRVITDNYTCSHVTDFIEVEQPEALCKYRARCTIIAFYLNDNIHTTQQCCCYGFISAKIVS